MTEVYLFDREERELPGEAALLLPAWRRERWERLKNEEARQESLAAGLLFARAMTRRGLSAEEMDRVTVLPAGKPTLRDRPALWFSLSHSGRYALCAVSDRPVGADVQQIRPAKLTIARRFHPEERDWLSRQPEEERLAALFRVWTRKEAWVKAVSGDRMLSLSEADVIHRLPGLSFREDALPGGYAAAVCGEEAEIPAPVPVCREELLDGLTLRSDT